MTGLLTVVSLLLLLVTWATEISSAKDYKFNNDSIKIYTEYLIAINRLLSDNINHYTAPSSFDKSYDSSLSQEFSYDDPYQEFDQETLEPQDFASLFNNDINNNDDEYWDEFLDDYDYFDNDIWYDDLSIDNCYTTMSTPILMSTTMLMSTPTQPPTILDIALMDDSTGKIITSVPRSILIDLSALITPLETFKAKSSVKVIQLFNVELANKLQQLEFVANYSRDLSKAFLAKRLNVKPNQFNFTYMGPITFNLMQFESKQPVINGLYTTRTRFAYLHTVRQRQAEEQAGQLTSVLKMSNELMADLKVALSLATIQLEFQIFAEDLHIAQTQYDVLLNILHDQSSQFYKDYVISCLKFTLQACNDGSISTACSIIKDDVDNFNINGTVGYNLNNHTSSTGLPEDDASNLTSIQIAACFIFVSAIIVIIACICTWMEDRRRMQTILGVYRLQGIL